jgi:hypothetical protein
MYMHMHIYMTHPNTYIHIYAPTYIHTYLHIHIHTYIFTYLHTYMLSYLLTCMRTYMHIQACGYACAGAYVYIGIIGPLSALKFAADLF